jgi:hypothetical protein
MALQKEYRGIKYPYTISKSDDKSQELAWFMKIVYTAYVFSKENVT